MQGPVFVANSNNQPVPVDVREIQGKISTVNSTSTLLAGGATFTGTAELTNGFGIIYVNVYSNVASATDGLVIEQSSDNVNWDHNDVYTIPAATGKNFSINPYARYVRISYTNGGTIQTDFRLQTIFKTTGLASSHRIQDDIVDEDDAELVKSVLTGKDPDGHYHNVSITHDADLSISDNSNGLSIAKGDVTGSSFVHKFGFASDFDTSDNEVTLWDGADDAAAWENMVYDYSATADIDSISSSDNGDTVDIEIQGLDTNFNLVTQTITLTGQTRAALTTDLIRVFRLKNVGATDLAGTVTCYPNTALTTGVPTDTSQIRAAIINGNNQTLMAVYTIPNGKTGYVRDWFASTAGANKTSNYVIKLKARESGGVFQLKHVSAIADNGTSGRQHKYEEPEVFPAKTDIELTCQMLAGGGTGAAVSGGFDIVLVDD